MTNRYYTEHSERKVSGGASPPPTGQKGKDQTSMPEKTANWPGLPGKTQPRDRSNGIRKLKVYSKNIGI